MLFRRLIPSSSPRQNSLKSLFYFHIGDVVSMFQNSDIWQGILEPMYEDDTWDIEFLPSELRPPRCERLDAMIINVIDYSMDGAYQLTMNLSHQHDRNEKVWNGTSTKECLTRLFRERWMNEPYEEELVESRGMSDDSSDMSEDTDNCAEDPWRSMRESDEEESSVYYEWDSNDSEDTSSSEESYEMDRDEMLERNKQLWQGL